MDNYSIVKKRRRNALRIANRKQPVPVVMTFLAGVVSLCTFIILCIISAINKGAGDEWLGIIPIVCLIINLISFVVSYNKLKAEDIKKGLVSVAACINGIMVILYLILYLVGFFIMFQ